MRNTEVQDDFFSFPEIDISHWHEVCEFVKRFGSYTSVALFDPGSEIFSVPHIDGVIGYRSTSKCAVVFGDPVCADEHIPELVKEFQKYCKEHQKQVIYNAVSQKFTNWSLENGCASAMEVAEEFFLNPQDNFLSGTKGRKLRIRVNQATKANIEVFEYKGFDPILEKAMDRVGHLWLEGREGPQIYLAHVDLFTDRIGKRWFYAQQNGEIIGVIQLNQLATGWVLNLSMTIPEVSAGTSEFMVLSMLQALKEEGCQSLSLGIVVREEAGNIVGFNSFCTKLLRSLYKVLIRIFRLQGRKRYWKKFNPTSSPCYLVCSRKWIGMPEISGILKSLNTSL